MPASTKPSPARSGISWRSMEGWKSKSNSSMVRRAGKWAKRSRAFERRWRVAAASSATRAARNSRRSSRGAVAVGEGGEHLGGAVQLEVAEVVLDRFDQRRRAHRPPPKHSQPKKPGSVWPSEAAIGTGWSSGCGPMASRQRRPSGDPPLGGWVNIASTSATHSTAASSASATAATAALRTTPVRRRSAMDDRPDYGRRRLLRGSAPRHDRRLVMGTVSLEFSAALFVIRWQLRSQVRGGGSSSSTILSRPRATMVRRGRSTRIEPRQPPRSHAFIHHAFSRGRRGSMGRSNSAAWRRPSCANRASSCSMDTTSS